VAVFKFRNLKNGQATPIPPGEFIIGRADDAYIHLEDGSVSRRHAQIINNNAGFFIEDLGSANGTAARGSYITRRMNVNLGDLIYIGSVPFRIDPEVEGEVDAAPSAGLRTSNRAYARRDTERLPPNMTDSIQREKAEQTSAEKLSAPEVNPTIDIDAGDLNAITLRESESAPAQPEENHKTEPAQKTIPAEIAPVRSSFPVPAPQRRTPVQPPSPAVLTHPQASRPYSAPSTIVTPTAQSTPTPVAAPLTPALGRTWLLAIFLAGIGAGLLMGLCFAKLFIEMGGKAASLP
jgi:predicted component of type VI protein secretion system